MQDVAAQRATANSRGRGRDRGSVATVRKLHVKQDVRNCETECSVLPAKRYLEVFFSQKKKSEIKKTEIIITQYCNVDA